MTNAADNGDREATERSDAVPPTEVMHESLFHSEPWRAAVQESFDLEIDSFTSTSEPDGSAYYSLIDDIRGRRIVSIPFSDFCEPHLTTEPGWQEYTAFLRSHECPITLRPFVNPIAVNDDSFEQRRELVWHGVDLSGGADAVFDNVNTKVRTKIRRPAKDGVTFRASSDPADIATMHDMHVDLRKGKYSMLAQPKRFFDTLHANFGSDMVVALAELDGSPIAAMTFFAYNQVWYYKFSASVPNRVRPNPALMMFAIELAAERGLTLVDMGRSDLDQPGLLAFKEQFEPRAELLTTLHWTPPEHHDPTGADVGALLGRLTAVITEPDVPADTARKASDLLYRYFT